MALEHAILVSLEEHSGTGYELARRFGKSIGYFWAASHQQIYRTLKRMVDLGWVHVEDIPQDGRPDKKLYRVSDEGRGELRRWLGVPGERTAIRNELAVKVRAASLGDPQLVMREVKHHRDQHAERLDIYRAIEKHDFPDPSRLTGQKLHQHLVLRAGIRAEQGFVDWCDEVLDALRRDSSHHGGSK